MIIEARTLAHHIPLSHLVISAPWIPTTNLASLTSQNPDLGIAVVSHSNIGFLQADPGAIELLRQGSELEQGVPLPHCGQLAAFSDLVAVDLRYSNDLVAQYVPSRSGAGRTTHVAARHAAHGDAFAHTAVQERAHRCSGCA
jgi:hypothetical protein